MMENIEKNEELLDGINKADLHCFIDKNASRYVDIYAKNEGKKFFLSWNWAAFFFHIRWLFYRKMYKTAALFMLIYSVINIIAILLISTAYMEELKPLYRVINEYEENFDSNALIENAINGNDVEVNVDPFEAYEAMDEFEFVMIKITLWSALVMIVLQIPFGFLADCLYRSHILKNINCSEGGTSYIAFIAGDICCGLFSEFIASPITAFLIGNIIKLAL